MATRSRRQDKTQQTGLPDSKNSEALPEQPEQQDGGRKKRKKRKKRHRKSSGKSSEGSTMLVSTNISQASSAWSSTTLPTADEPESCDALPFRSSSSETPRLDPEPEVESAGSAAAPVAGRLRPEGDDAPQQTTSEGNTSVPHQLPQTSVIERRSSVQLPQQTTQGPAEDVPEPDVPAGRERLLSEASLVAVSPGTLVQSRRASSRHWGGSLFDMSPSTKFDETTLVLGSRASMPEVFGRWGMDEASPDCHVAVGPDGLSAAPGSMAAGSLQRTATSMDAQSPSFVGQRRPSIVHWPTSYVGMPDRRSMTGASEAAVPGQPTKSARSESETRAPYAAVRGTRGGRVDNEQIMVAGSLCCTFWLTTLGILLLMWGHHVPEDREDPLCKTDDCVRHAELIANITSATDLDPCEDFGAYVCSAVSSPTGEADPKGNNTVPSAMDAAIHAWLGGLGGMLRDGSLTFPTGRKPLEMYESCMGVDGSRDYGTDPTEFLRFLKEVGLSWPDDPPKGVDAVSVFVSLAFLYEAPAWFSVSIAESPSASQEWRLVVSPDRYTSTLWARRENTMQSEAYVSFWKTMQRSLVGDSATSVDEKAIEETAKMEGDVLSKLHAALTRPLKRTALCSIADLANYTTSITSASWFRALAGCLPLHPTLATEVFLTNTAYVRTIGDLFAAYDDQKLVRHLSWTFVQVYGPVVNPHLFSDRPEDAKIALVYRPSFCGLNVEIPYKLLLSTLYYVSRISDHDRASVDAAFDNLIVMAAEKVSNSSWLDADGKYLTEAKMKAVNASFWPNEALLKTRLLEHTYEEFPENRTSFSAYWVDSRRAICRTKSRHQRYRRHSAGPINSREPYLMYDAVAHSVQIALGALVPPLYYRNATRGAMYGGIGFLMALNIVKSIDREGLRWDPNGNFVDSFLSQASLEQFVMLDSCPGRGRQRTAFPEIPATEVAYAALQAALKKDGRRYRIAKHLSEEKVFFITLCYMTCARGGVGSRHAGDNCNKALKNLPEFARTFSCPQGSKMNPRSKCLFFD